VYRKEGDKDLRNTFLGLVIERDGRGSEVKRVAAV
jgi:hypothetical protein